MSYNRRDFLKFGGLTLGVMPLFGRVFGRSNTPINFSPDAVSFQKLLGSQFTVYQKNSATTAVLTEVKIEKTPQKNDGAECFSLLFEMPSDDFGQKTYEMFHPAIGMFEMFLVPGKSKKGIPLLIGVINRI